MLVGAGRGALQGNNASFDDRFGSFSSAGNNAGLQQGLQNRANQLNGVKPPVDDQAVLRNISLQQQQLALYGQTATALEAVKQVELQVQTARLQGVAIDQKRVEVLKQLAYEQALGITQIRAQTDAARIETATIGMSSGAAAEYTAVQNRLNEARRNGQVLRPEEIARIKEEAAALGQAAGQADLMRAAYTGLVQGPLQTLTSSIAGGSSAWDAFKKAGISALNSIASKLADIAAQNLWMSAFGGSSGGGFSLGSLFGLGGGAGSVGSYGQVSNATGLGAGTGGLSFPMFAGGTNSAPGGPAIINENGGEIVDLPSGARVIPHDISMRMAAGGNTPVILNDNRVINVGQGASQETVALLREELAQDRRERVAQVEQIVRNGRRQRRLA